MKLVFHFAFLTSCQLLAAEVATVKSQPVEVMRKAAKGAGVVGRLEAGSQVKIDFTVGNGEGTWCSVTSTGKDALSGYILCDQLARPVVAKERVVMPIPESAAPAAPTPEPRRQADPQKLKELELYNYHPFYWADRLGFNAAQRARMTTMLEENGVMKCSAETQQVVVRHGITQMSAFIKALSDPKFGKELMVPFEACSEKLNAFWSKFPLIFTPAQRARFDSDRSLLPQWTGFAESQMLLMFGQLGPRR